MDAAWPDFALVAIIISFLSELLRFMPVAPLAAVQTGLFVLLFRKFYKGGELAFFAALWFAGAGLFALHLQFKYIRSLQSCDPRVQMCREPIPQNTLGYFSEYFLPIEIILLLIVSMLIFKTWKRKKPSAAKHSVPDEWKGVPKPKKRD